MTPKDLAAIKERADAATPGPWEAEGDGGITMDGVRDGYMVKVAGHGFPVFRARSSNRVQRQFDATFIAAARQDIPHLVAALEAAQAEVAALHRMMESPEWQAQMAKSIAFFEAGFKGKTLDEIDEQQRVIRDLRAEVAEHEELFEATWAATTRGIAMWRAAHPGKELHMPDTANHTVWLIEQLAERDQRIAEQTTLIDFCDAMATSIRNDWSDPRTECRAIWDAHDMAHVLAGGDKTRDWSNARAMAVFTDDDDANRFGHAWPDVKRRMAALMGRLRGEPV